MKAAIIGLLAETSLHPGAESTGGVVDLPVAREAATGYPVIPGSGLKGALRDKAEQEWGEHSAIVKEIFGEPDGAGGVAVTDARLILLPVRSLNSPYRWVTCPHLLERLQRDMTLAGSNPALELLPIVNDGEAVARDGGNLFLEELSFRIVPDTAVIEAVAAIISQLVYHLPVRKRLASQLVIVSDCDFAYLVRYGLPVNARNVLNNDTKTSDNLWYEETISPDTLFYALLLARPGKDRMQDQLRQLFNDYPYLQVGGNETVGQGWCAVAWRGEGESA